MTTATAQDTRHLREVLSLELLQELQNASPRPPKPAPRKEDASSIKGAIARWLNEQL